MPKKRKPESRRAKPVFRIYCEGEKTEPKYLERYIADFGPMERRSVIRIQPTNKNTPVQLVKEACEYKSSDKSLLDDIVWVVYDRESEAKYSEALHEQAYNKARAKGVSVAISNVCFEYWILLHLIDTSAPYTSYDNLHHQSALGALFKEKCGADYSKGKADIYNAVKENIPLARSRAKKLNEKMRDSAHGNKSKPYQTNPYTNVWELLDAIDGFD